MMHVSSIRNVGSLRFASRRQGSTRFSATGSESLHPVRSLESSAGEAPDRSVVRVALAKQDGAFGFAYRGRGAKGVHGLVITALVPEGALDMWNEASDPEYDITVGDIVINVNEVHCSAGGHAMLKEMRVNSLCTLTIRKRGPRWHMLGIVAECLEKINHAQEQGMTLDLVKPEFSDQEDDDTQAESQDLSCGQLLLVVLAVALPNLALVAMCSDIGLGIRMYSLFAARIMNLGGNGIIFIGTMMALGLWIADWLRWTSQVQRFSSMLLMVYTMCFGAILKCRFYPQAPLVIILFHVPAFLGLLRASSLRTIRRRSFYVGVSGSTLVIGLALLALWGGWMMLDDHTWSAATKQDLIERSVNIYEATNITFTTSNCEPRERPLVYEWDCVEEPSAYDFEVVQGIMRTSACRLLPEDWAAILKQCGTIKSVWFLVWLSPFVAAVCSLVVAAFCFITGVIVNIQDTTRAEEALKTFILMICVLLLMMWVSVSVAGASMRLTGTLIAFGCAGMLALFVWAYMEIGRSTIASTLRKSKLMMSIIVVITSDWTRAMAIICMNFTLPVMLVVEALRQRTRKLRNVPTTDQWLTEEAHKVLDNLSNWRWAGIFIKVNWLVILYWTFAIGVAKVTYVFLSWLNGMFAQNVAFVAVVSIFFLVGYTMFLLPPVPGIPVYITSGIIIAAQARSTSLGYYGGITLAVAVSFVLKLAAVCGQYAIGYFLGRSVKVQQFVAVDKVFTRAIEKILQTKGLNLAKVSVLVGGPDWPTSVLCGVLRLNLCQCLLGTVPVILVSSPCVLAGAFMASPKEVLTSGEDSKWGALANSALAVSAIVQMLSGVLALYFIHKTMHEHEEELQETRPEHAQVVALTIAERDYVQCRSEVLEWHALSCFWRCFISMTMLMMLGCLFLFVFMDELCFKSFEVKDKIDAPEEEGGLGVAYTDFGGAVFKMVEPLGLLALMLFSTATLFHLVFVKYIALRASARLEEQAAASHGQALAEWNLSEEGASDGLATSRCPSEAQPCPAAKLSCSTKLPAEEVLTEEPIVYRLA